jgi:hypothetical protein
MGEADQPPEFRVADPGVMTGDEVPVAGCPEVVELPRAVADALGKFGLAEGAVLGVRL